MENKLEKIEKIFALARMKGLCKTQKEFAELVGVHPSTISLAMKGDERYLTDKLALTVERWSMLEGLQGEAPKPAQPDIVIPAATAALYNNMSETIRIQAEIIARLQGGTDTRYGVNGYAQKNYRTDISDGR